MKPFPTSAACCFGILFISVSLKTTGSSEVVGSADPVVALAGDDVILPCSLKPSVSAKDMVVKWTGLFLETRNVHLYLDGRDSNADQFPSYRRRTSMFNEELKNGNVSLKLTRVTLSDAGSYRCFIPTLTSQVKETTVQLIVGAVSQPVISIDGTKGLGVVLKCESGGWYPEPEMVWLDSSGTILPADGPPERNRDSEDLYTVIQHVTVDQTDTNRFTCIVQQQKINHLKETEIHVPYDLFPKSHVVLIVGLSIAAAVGVLSALAGVYMWRKHKAQLRREKAQLSMQKAQLSMQKDELRREKDEVSMQKDEVSMQKAQLSMQKEEVSMQKDRLSMLNAQLRREKAQFRKKKAPSTMLNAQFTIQYEEVRWENEEVRWENEELSMQKAPAKTEREEVSMQKEELSMQKVEDIAGKVEDIAGKVEDIAGKEEVSMQKAPTIMQTDELKEKLMKAEETIKTLSTSPGGQQKTQTPSQKSEGEGMEMKPLLGSGPQKDDLDEMERGGRV